MNVEPTGTQNVVITACQVAYRKVAELSGRGIAILKSGSDTILPYFQDRRIAIVSLIAINLILIEIAHLFTFHLGSYLPNESKKQKNIKRAFEISLGLSMVALGVVAFVKFTNLSVSWLSVAGITIATLLIRAQFSKPPEVSVAI